VVRYLFFEDYLLYLQGLPLKRRYHLRTLHCDLSMRFFWFTFEVGPGDSRLGLNLQASSLYNRLSRSRINHGVEIMHLLDILCLFQHCRILEVHALPYLYVHFKAVFVQ
jgi:hypothetical protein